MCASLLPATCFLAIGLPARDPSPTTLGGGGGTRPLALSLRLEAEASVEYGARYLAGKQVHNGSWANNPAVTASAAVAKLNMAVKAGDVSDDMLSRALKFIADCAAPDGSIVNRRSQQCAPLSTAISLQALVRDLRPKYQLLAARARDYLLQTQNPDGGFPAHDGADSDLVTTLYVTETLYISRLGGLDPEGHDATEKALAAAGRYMALCQNVETGKAGTKTDSTGSFSRQPPGTNASNEMKAMPASPAFLTCCGLRGLLYTGLETSSPRVVQAMHWLNEHAQIDVNPGYDQRGYYTYLLGFARTMRACEVAGADFTNTAKLRDWRNLVTAELLKRQTGLGQWRKGERDWWENNPELITAYAIFTLSNTLL